MDLSPLHPSLLPRPRPPVVNYPRFRPLPPSDQTRIYMLVRKTIGKSGYEDVTTAYRISPDETPLDTQYKWSEVMSTLIAIVWADVLQASDVSCKILACDLQIGKHFKTLLQRDAFEVYTSLANCTEGSFSWGDDECNYEGGVDGILALISVREISKSGEEEEEEKRRVNWEVVHVDVPSHLGGA